MGRKSRAKNRRTAEPCVLGQGEKTAFAAANRPAQGPAPRVRKPYTVLAVCGFLVFAVLAVFIQTANYDFVNFDDNEYVSENPHVKGGLTRDGIAWAITAYHSNNWHPLTWLSHMLDCQLYGLKPGCHHLTNVLLHAATAIFLFLSLQRMTGALWPSAFVGAVFAIHPLRVESVAWVAERKDVLSGLFFMLTLWFYVRYVERPASWAWYLLVLVSFALGLTAKPMLVTLPFVLLLLDYWPLGRFRRVHGRLRLLVEKIPLFVLSAASCVVTLAAQRDAINLLEQVSLSERLANAAVAYVAYLGKMFYPADLAILYPLPKDPPPAGEVIAAVTVLLAISTAVAAVRRKRPYLLVGWLWYLGTLAPVIGLVQAGSQKMADRYTYLPQIGLYTAFAWGAAHVVQAAGAWRYRRLGFAAVSALVVAGLMICAWRQTHHWRDSESLWTHTIDCTSQNPIAHLSFAHFLTVRGRFDEAVAHYEKALEIRPDDAEAHNNLGLALAGCGQIDEAIDHYQKALAIEPDRVEAHYNLGLALMRREQFEEAIAHYRRAVEIKPGYIDARYMLGNALARQGMYEDATDQFRRVLDVKPNYAEAHYYLGLALAHRGQTEEAIEHYRKALEIKADNLNAHYNLASALIERGKFDEAIEQYQKALELASAQKNSALAEDIRARIKLAHGRN